MRFFLGARFAGAFFFLAGAFFFAFLRGVRTGPRLSSTITTNIRLFSVDEAGDYTFRGTQSGEHSLKIRSITLELRENVAVVNTAMAATGCVLAFGAFVSVVFGAGFRGRRRDEQGAEDEPERASAD